MLTVLEPESDVRNDKTLMIRYMGPDHARQFVIQRGDDQFWTGGGFSRVLDTAKVFRDHKRAQAAVTAIQHRRYGDKPVRSFRLEVEVTLVADDADGVSRDVLIRFLADAMRIDFETSVFGDGPVEESLVQARVKLATLEEVIGEQDRGER